MKWEIRYYLTENAKRAKIPAFKETLDGNKQVVESWAKNRLKNPKFVSYEVIQK